MSACNTEPSLANSSGVYRDATYSAQTQEELKRLAAWLRDRTPATDPGLIALDDVIARWDANGATEMVGE